MNKIGVLSLSLLVAIARANVCNIDIFSVTSDGAVRGPRNDIDSSNCTSIDISNTGIMQIFNGTFENLVNVEHIDMSFNQLAILPKGILTGLKALTSLDVSNNRITEIDAQIFSITEMNENDQVENVFLSQNGPSSFENNFIECCPSQSALNLIESYGIPFECVLDDGKKVNTTASILESCGQCTVPATGFGRCGPNHNFVLCEPGACCSASGWCDTTFAHCISGFCGPADTCPGAPRDDDRCGELFNGANCKVGFCCSRFGYCIEDSNEYCSTEPKYARQCKSVSCDALTFAYLGPTGFCENCTESPNCAEPDKMNCASDSELLKCKQCNEGFFLNDDGLCESESSALSTGAIVAIVVCSVLAVLGVVGLFIFWRLKKKQKDKLIDGLSPKEWVNLGQGEKLALQTDEEYMATRTESQENIVNRGILTGGTFICACCQDKYTRDEKGAFVKKDLTNSRPDFTTIQSVYIDPSEKDDTLDTVSLDGYVVNGTPSSPKEHKQEPELQCPDSSTPLYWAPEKEAEKNSGNSAVNEYFGTDGSNEYFANDNDEEKKDYYNQNE